MKDPADHGTAREDRGGRRIECPAVDDSVSAYQAAKAKLVRPRYGADKARLRRILMVLGRGRVSRRRPPSSI